MQFVNAKTTEEHLLLVLIDRIDKMETKLLRPYNMLDDLTPPFCRPLTEQDDACNVASIIRYVCPPCGNKSFQTSCIVHHVANVERLRANGFQVQQAGLPQMYTITWNA